MSSKEAIIDEEQDVNRYLEETWTSDFKQKPTKVLVRNKALEVFPVSLVCCTVFVIPKMEPYLLENHG